MFVVCLGSVMPMCSTASWGLGPVCSARGAIAADSAIWGRGYFDLFTVSWARMDMISRDLGGQVWDLSV